MSEGNLIIDSAIMAGPQWHQDVAIRFGRAALAGQIPLYANRWGYMAQEKEGTRVDFVVRKNAKSFKVEYAPSGVNPDLPDNID